MFVSLSLLSNCHSYGFPALKLEDCQGLINKGIIFLGGATKKNTQNIGCYGSICAEKRNERRYA